MTQLPPHIADPLQRAISGQELTREERHAALAVYRDNPEVEPNWDFCAKLIAGPDAQAIR